jgi:hypothetical protein
VRTDGPIAHLVELDRRVLPPLADALDRLTSPAARGRGRGLDLSPDARRVLGGLALVLLLSALALVLLGR